MSRHIGIVACSPPGAALCYQIISSSPDAPEVSLHAHPFEEYIRRIRRDDWERVADLMLDSAEKLAEAGADFLIAPCNTIHQAMQFVTLKSPLPWLHIAAEVACEAKGRGFRRIALLGTKSMLASSVYSDHFREAGLAFEIPEAGECDDIDRFIFDEMVGGTFSREARARIEEVIARMKRAGCDAAGLCCTELPLLFDQGETALPLLDSTRILANAAIERSRQC